MDKNTKETRGRPTKFTDEVIRKIEEVAALDGTVKEMAFYAGIHFDSIYAWMKDNPEFSERIAALREKPVLKARQAVVRSLDDPDRAFRYLERKKKNEFAQRVESTGTDGEPIVVKLVQYGSQPAP